MRLPLLNLNNSGIELQKQMKLGMWKAHQPQMLNMLAIKYQDNFIIFSVYLSNVVKKKKKNVEDSVETLVYYVGNGFSIPRHFAKDYDLVF